MMEGEIVWYNFLVPTQRGEIEIRVNEIQPKQNRNSGKY